MASKKILTLLLSNGYATVPVVLRQSGTNDLKASERHKDNSVQPRKTELNVSSSRIQVRRKESARQGGRESKRESKREKEKERETPILS